jgi:signal peptidase II
MKLLGDGNEIPEMTKLTPMRQRCPNRHGQMFSRAWLSRKGADPGSSKNKQVPDVRSKRRLTLTVAAVVVAVDAVSKAAAARYLAGRGTVHVLGGALRLELYRNYAGPHNTFQGHPVLVSLMALAGVAAIAVLATRVRTTVTAVAAGLLLGGGIGNLLDRLMGAPGPLRGGVIDWLKPGWSSGSMNLADLSLTVAVVVLLATAARRSRDSSGRTLPHRT